MSYYIMFLGCSGEVAHANLYEGGTPAHRVKLGEVVLKPGIAIRVHDDNPGVLQLGVVYELSNPVLLEDAI